MNRSRQLQRAIGKRLKDESTQYEGTLWPYLRNRRLLGRKFRRQRRLGCLWADFCCDELKLIVEVDGGVHDDPAQRIRDRDRQAFLETRGYLTIRIRNEEIDADLSSVLSELREAVQQRQEELANKLSSPLPILWERGGGEGA